MQKISKVLVHLSLFIVLLASHVYADTDEYMYYDDFLFDAETILEKLKTKL